MIKEADEQYDRVLSIKDNETKALVDVIDRYHQGNINVIQALNEIRTVLVSIQSSRG